MQRGEQRDQYMEVTAQRRAVRSGVSPHLTASESLLDGFEQARKPMPASSEEQPSPQAMSRILITMPPPIDPQMTMQRADEISTVQNMLTDGHTSSVVLIGSPAAGKSTLAALIYQRLQLTKQQGLLAPHHLVWLTLNSYTTLPDLIAAILHGVGAHEPSLFLLKPEQQISTLLRTLRRPQENALVVLDQFESLLYPEVNQGVAGRGALPAFLNMLQMDLGASRILLTNYESPFQAKDTEEIRVRSYLVSRISLPEGVALLQQRGVRCTPEQLSLIWQRCTGNVFSLVLFSALVQVSELPIDTLLNADEFKPMWGGDVIVNLITGIYHYLNTTQRTILYILSVFNDPTPLEGVIATIAAYNTADQPLVPATCERELLRFVQFGLVQPVFDTSGTLCYTVHSLLRQYIPEHFIEENPLPSTFATIPNNEIPNNATPQQAIVAIGHRQIAQYYRQLIPKQCPPLNQRQNPLDVETIIKAIRHHCLGWQWQQACELLFEERLQESMIQWGAWNTLLGLYIALLPPFGSLAHRDEALVASHVAMIYGRFGEHQQSKTYFEQALTLQQQIGDLLGQAMTLTNQGELLRLRGEYQQARQNFEYALSLLKENANEQLHCILLHNMGLITQYEKDYNQASAYYTEALRLATATSKQDYAGVILTNLGMLLYEKNEHKEALALMLASLRMREVVHDPTVPTLERFLVALEQKMGSEAYTTLCKEALEIQSQVFSRFAPTRTQP
jgi:tetratricopeptide (TPR) repeat protein